MAIDYFAEVKNGRLVLDDGLPPLPEGGRYRLVPLEVTKTTDLVIEEAQPRTIVERYASIIGIAGVAGTSYEDR